MSFTEFCAKQGWGFDCDPETQAAHRKAWNDHVDEMMRHPAPPITRKLECRMYFTWRDDPEWRRRHRP